MLFQCGAFIYSFIHAFPTCCFLPGGLSGQYFSDAYFQHVVFERIDYVVNFTWGMGRITPNGANYVSVRWTGAVLSGVVGYYSFRVQGDAMARLWVDGDLLLDQVSELP